MKWCVVAAVMLFGSTAFADVKECADAYERAQELRLSGKLRDARTQLETCTSPTCPKVIRVDCTTWLGEVSKAMPSVIIAAEPDATVTIDGARATGNVAVEVDPGTHRIVVGATSTTVTIALGEQHRRIELQHPTEPAPPVVTTKTPGPPFYTWIAGGIGVAGIISFAAWGTAAIVLENDLRSSCYGSCAPVDVVRMQNRALAADISLGIGIVGLATAAVLFFLPRHAKVERAALLGRFTF
jgi:hypothetical protein